MKKYLLLLLLSISAIAIFSITAPAAVSNTSVFSCSLPPSIWCGEFHNYVTYMTTYVYSTSPSGVSLCVGYSNGVTAHCIPTKAGGYGLDFTSDYPTGVYSFYANAYYSYTINSTNRDFWCNCA
jgi:hypothetical protein